MTFKTMREQEREAYITGHTSMAKLLAAAHDLELAEVEHEDEEDRAWEKDQEIARLEEDSEAADTLLTNAKNDIEELEMTNARLEREIAELNELISDLRHTIRGDK